MISVQKAYANDFDRVYPLLHEFDPQISQEQWQSIFQRHWESQDAQCGYLLIDGNEVAGFIGVMLTQREVGGRLRKFCDLGTWIVKPSHRNQSLNLLLTVLRQKEWTFTGFTANEHAHVLLKKMGFKDYQTQWRWVVPRPWPSTGSRILWGKNRIRESLDAPQRKIFEDHAKFNCFHALMEAQGESCYMILTRPKRKLPRLELHYASDYDLLARHIVDLANASLTLKAAGVLVPGHRLSPPLPAWTWPIQLKYSRLYKSADLSLKDIDTLYSELFVLGI
ncbi:MAG: GNAT family N-acetyltransferase [Candidatus Omnitrophica bacterium]|nr:GNAT family N-acetyltransferase [Candidatus Omnitrophota bacterium]